LRIQTAVAFGVRKLACALRRGSLLPRLTVICKNRTEEPEPQLIFTMGRPCRKRWAWYYCSKLQLRIEAVEAWRAGRE